MSLNVAIVGVTGAVGQEFLKILEQREFPAKNYRLLASARSAGKKVSFMDKSYTIGELTEDSFEGIDIALFSAGGSISKAFGPVAAGTDCVVVDNSSAFRMDENTPLVIPEVNADAIRDHHGVIANPNCSTIIANVPVWPLHQANPVKRMVVSTYQAVSGAGVQAMEELSDLTRDVLDGKEAEPRIFKYPCAFNVFSHDSDIGDNGYNTEEMKMIHETHKIFGDDSIAITCTCVRVPVMRAHCESINLEFTDPIELDSVIDILHRAEGVTVLDDRENNRFPMPLDAANQDDIFVGRIRYDESLTDKRGVNLWIAGDQIRKGAALNAVQIAEKLL
jgi:aspartate-semialdehyde dehydrogenase